MAQNMEPVIQQQVIQVAHHLEKELDAELERLDTLDINDLDKLRENRLKQLKKQQKQKETWICNGHGEYSEIPDEKEFFEASKKSENIVCLFYKDDSPRSKIVDHHLKILARKHIEARFCKLNVERCPFLAERLRIKIIPTIALIVNSKTKDYIVGFTELGNRDDFSTQVLEARIGLSGVIEYHGDIAEVAENNKKPWLNHKPKSKTIRGRGSDDSDDDFE